MSKYTLSEAAKRDLINITKYTARQFGEDQAREYYYQIHSSAAMAASFPALGKTYKTEKGKDFQIYLTGRHLLFYIKRDDDILIVRVLHERMDYDQHL